MTDLTVTARRTIKAPANKIYDAWLNAKMMAKYMLASADMAVTDTMTDARVGGRFAFSVVMNGEVKPHGGTYLDLKPHSRIAFTWESPYAAPGSTVTLDLSPAGEATEVVLTHVKFTSEASRDGHSKVWTVILGELAKQV